MPKHPCKLFRRLLPRLVIVSLAFVSAAVWNARASLPGGGTGTGANVTLTSTSTTATMSNGIVSILCTKSGATINQINYTFNNNGSSQTLNLLSGGNNGGLMYWEHSNNQGLVFTYSVVADPTTNGGDYAEIALYSTTQADMPFEVHYSMRRGSPGYYVTAIWTHNSSNGAFGMGECRSNIYAGSIFNWMSVDATRNKLMEVSGGTAIGVPTAPVECSLWTNGIYQGRYEDKYKYSADFGDQRVWGWSSVGTSGKNVGLWNVSATSEYYNGGPLKPELMCHIGTTILNMLNGGHYGMGSDGTFVAGETWAKVCGPYFVYCNNVAKTITDQVQASQALYTDAVAQRRAYSGTVTGGGTLTMAVNYVSGDVGGDWSAFTGRINVIRTHTGTTVDPFRLASNTGFGVATIDLGPYVQAQTTLNAGNTFTIGQLSGDVTAKLAGTVPTSGTPGANTLTYAVGGRDTDAVYAGAIINGTSPSVTAITKEGAGTSTLSGANTYTGATSVNEGILNLTGSLSNTSSLIVVAGSTLVLNGGTVSMTGPVTNNGVIRVNGAGSLSTTGTFTNNGVLDLINGSRTLPANFINNGSVLGGNAIVVNSISRGANGVCSLVVPGYAGHTYQLMGTASLSTPNWTNAGTSQSVPATQTGSPLPSRSPTPQPPQTRNFTGSSSRRLRETSARISKSGPHGSPGETGASHSERFLMLASALLKVSLR